MNRHAICQQDSPGKAATLRLYLFIGAIGIGIVLAGVPAQANDSQTLWECSNYTGDAHTRCLKAFAESQRDQIATLRGKLQAQQETIDRLKDQLDRQTSRSADLQRRLAQPPAIVQTVPPLYVYPPVGFSLHLGSPWIYGAPFYSHPFGFGPHFFGLRYRSYYGW